MLDGLIQAIPAHEFFFGRCTGIWDTLGCECALLVWVGRGWSVEADAESDGGCTGRSGPSDKGVARSARDCTSHVERTTHHALRLLSGAHPCVIFTGHSDPRRMVSLSVRKIAFESAIKSGKKTEEMGRFEWWTASDGRVSEEEVEKAKRGFIFGGNQVERFDSIRIKATRRGRRFGDERLFVLLNCTT